MAKSRELTSEQRESGARALRDSFFERDCTDENWKTWRGSWHRIFALLETNLGAAGMRVIPIEKGDM
jgi:hypothetical protein